jgi:hypothetical protein
MLGQDFIHRQRKILRKEYDIVDVEVTVPEILKDMETKKNAYKMASFA